MEDLTRFMAMNPNQEDALDTSFFLGASLVQVRKPELAIPHLTRFITEDKKSKSRDYAMLLASRAGGDVCTADRQSARRVLALAGGPVHSGRLAHPVKPDAECRAEAGASVAPG